MAIILPDLPSADLEPYIDAATPFCHDKHHATYGQNANAVLKNTQKLVKTLKQILADVE